MKKIFLSIMTGMVGGFFVFLVPVHASAAETTQLIVRFKKEKHPTALWQRTVGIEKTEPLIHTPLPHVTRTKQQQAKQRLQRTYIIEVPKTDAEEMMNDLLNDPRVAAVEPNTVFHLSTFPLDTHFSSKQWNMHNNGTIGTEDVDIDAPEAWSSIHDSSVPIAIVDSGIDTTHEDLSGNLWINPGETDGDGIDNDDNGYIDDINGWDFVNNDNDPFDDNGHGTHIAGIAGAVSHNNKGVAGIVWDAQLVALKAFDENGDGTLSDVLEALTYAESMDIPISNNSYNSDEGFSSQTFSDLITVLDEDNHLFIAAAGNAGVNIDTSPTYPASFSNDNIVSVASTTYNDGVSSFSNTGATSVDLAAPGSSIYSTVPTDACELCAPGGYRYQSGTSMAAPHVAGVAALIWEQNSALTNDQVKTALMNSGDSLSVLASTTVSGKRLNALGALEFVENTPPVARFTLSDTSILENDAVSFDASTSSDVDNDTLTYSWDFGDGTTGLGVGPSHTFDDPGTYTVTLTVSDGTWSVTAEKSIRVTAIEYEITNVHFKKKKLLWDATEGMTSFQVKLRFIGKKKTRTIKTWKRGNNEYVMAKKIKRFLGKNEKYQKRKRLRIRVVGTTPENEIKKSSLIKIPKKRFKKWKKDFLSS